MTATPKKTIVVLGATGNQGGSVARTFSSLPNWHVRCVTRNPSSAAAGTLSRLGAEIVQADLADLDSLVRAFSSANAIFANTDLWATVSDPGTAAKAEAAGKSSSELAMDVEVSHGVNIAHAAAGVATLERFIYSALGPMNQASKGKYTHSYHWEAKAKIVEYIETQQPALARSMSVIYLGAYVTNPALYPRWDEQARQYVLGLPMTKDAEMPIIDPTESTGPFVRALVEDEDPGKRLLAYDSNSNLRMGDLAEMWKRVLARDVALVYVPLEAMQERTGWPIEVLEGPAFISEFGYMHGVDNVIVPAQLKNKVVTKSFEEWLKERSWGELLDQSKT
ncbi:hypothetical protein A1O3_02462 [Capronia epimyces CBS 606.96]|uniref:NmrA-like domain-containing protein n=1 Tax=Capronia epimyces CBS 606.96 TaxID=1182542 RepID=W9YIC4_9EURO|nr:uncharacterized protein A1O3_02462 [Capronia epimyces CBS 606.96]EXJ89395.1 hypothetical protein A1O3_02462 [Capronia epimyces CBS 606.96]